MVLVLSDYKDFLRGLIKIKIMAKLKPENILHNMYVSHTDRFQVLGRFVKDLATLSKCTKRGVAAIIIDGAATQIYSIGINGGPQGGVDCLCAYNGKYSCIHAESNAIAKCNTHDNSKIMICTLSPCVTCASLIVNSGFSAFFYLERWDDTTGLGILQSANIYTEQLKLSKEGR